MDLEMLVDGVDFGEGPRWHDGRLWYSDFHQRAVYTVTSDGTREAAHADLPDRPSGLGWLPDGTLLVVAMLGRKVWREEGGRLVDFADLSGIATGHCNDMVVSAEGYAYVGNFGFDLEGAGVESYRRAHLALVRPDGGVEVAAEDLDFPNGSVITPDGQTLIVGESGGQGYVAFTIGDDGRLSDRRDWARVPGSAPDGCALDAEGAIWFSDAYKAEVVRVKEGGEVTHRLPTPMNTYACMLGGDDGRSLFVLCAPDSHPDQVAGKAAGAVYVTAVDVPTPACRRELAASVLAGTAGEGRGGQVTGTAGNALRPPRVPRSSTGRKRMKASAWWKGRASLEAMASE